MTSPIADLFFNKPWAIKEDYLPIISEIIDRHLKGEKLSRDTIEMKVSDRKKDSKSYEVINGNAIIPVQGVISKRMTWLMEVSQMGSSVQMIRGMINNALADDAVKVIALDIDSPGGSSDGVAEISDYIFEARKQKTILAFGDGLMASAAYFIASAATKVYATKGTDVGSIGVYSVIYDMSVLRHNQGVNVEVIKAGRFKAAGHPEKPITAEDRNVVQSKVDEVYDLFVSAVKRNRDMTDAQAMDVATGQTWIASKAFGNGLIDGVDELSRYLARASASGGKQSGKIRLSVGDKTQTKPKMGGISMNWDELKMEDLQQNRPDIADALKKQGHAAGYKEGKEVGVSEGRQEGLNDGKVQGVEEGKQEGISFERTRVKAVIANGKNMPGCEAIVEKCLVEGINDDESLKQMQDAKLSNIQDNTPDSLGPNAQANTEQGDNHMDKALAYKEQNKCTLAEALSATAPGRKTALV